MSSTSKQVFSFETWIPSVANSWREDCVVISPFIRGHPVHIFFFPPAALAGEGESERLARGGGISMDLHLKATRRGERVGTARAAQGWKNGRGLRGQPLVFTRRKYLVTKGLSTLILIPGFFLFSQRERGGEFASGEPAAARNLQRSLLSASDPPCGISFESISYERFFLEYSNASAELLDLSLDLPAGKVFGVLPVALRESFPSRRVLSSLPLLLLLPRLYWLISILPFPLSFPSLATVELRYFTKLVWSQSRTPPGYWISFLFFSLVVLSRAR